MRLFNSNASFEIISTWFYSHWTINYNELKLMFVHSLHRNDNDLWFSFWTFFYFQTFSNHWFWVIWRILFWSRCFSIDTLTTIQVKSPYFDLESFSSAALFNYSHNIVICLIYRSNFSNLKNLRKSFSEHQLIFIRCCWLLVPFA